MSALPLKLPLRIARFLIFCGEWHSTRQQLTTQLWKTDLILTIPNDLCSLRLTPPRSLQTFTSIWSWLSPNQKEVSEALFGRWAFWLWPASFQQLLRVSLSVRRNAIRTIVWKRIVMIERSVFTAESHLSVFMSILDARPCVTDRRVKLTEPVGLYNDFYFFVIAELKAITVHFKIKRIIFIITTQNLNWVYFQTIADNDLQFSANVGPIWFMIY